MKLLTSLCAQTKSYNLTRLISRYYIFRDLLCYVVPISFFFFFLELYFTLRVQRSLTTEQMLMLVRFHSFCTGNFLIIDIKKLYWMQLFIIFKFSWIIFKIHFSIKICILKCVNKFFHINNTSLFLFHNFEMFQNNNSW